MDTNLHSLLNDTSGGTNNSLFSLPAGITTLITVFTITASVASIVIVVLYFVNALTTYRAHRATIEMRDILREMNERDKARSKPVAASAMANPAIESELTAKN
ncbi:MAG TPA: hypothetical protein VLF64_00365 [Candidatus Saccharimonadales bacterium]|nr:hypothetical protein [Candidatus Saccharimonadales bacterium]